MNLIPYQSSQHGSASQEELAAGMDLLLMEYQTYQQHVRKLNWDQRLRPYLDFQHKTDILYRVAENNTHSLAEEIMRLGYTPTLRTDPSAALIPTRIAPVIEYRDVDEAIREVMQMSGQVLETVEDLFYLAAELEEDKSIELMRNLAAQLSFTIGVFNSVRLTLGN